MKKDISLTKNEIILSIITICRNSYDTIGSTIMSVLPVIEGNQNIEYIIKDGKSNDGTFEKIKEMCEGFNQIKIIQNLDKGIYHAMNESLKYAGGKYVLFLNSDDLLLKSSLIKIIKTLTEDDFEYFVSPIAYFKRPSLALKRFFFIKNNFLSLNFFERFIFSPYPPHPGFICKKDILIKIGFNTNYKISADYLLMQEIIMNGKYKMKFIKTPLVAMALGGTSLKWNGIARGNKEIRLINKKINFQESIFIRYLRNFMQIFLSKFIKFKINEENLQRLKEFN